MKHRAACGLILLSLGMALACGGGSEVSTSEQTFLSYRECGRTARHPELTLVVEQDGETSELWGAPYRHALRWGYETRVRLEHRRNSTTGHTDTRIETVLDERPTPGETFRMRACGPTFLAEDGRSLLDGKRFRCAPAVCEQLDARRADLEVRFDLLFQFADPVTEPLQLLTVEDPTCDDAYDCSGQDQVCCGERCATRSSCRGQTPPP